MNFYIYISQLAWYPAILSTVILRYPARFPASQIRYPAEYRIKKNSELSGRISRASL
jgi:hypothetical protein